MLGWRQHWGHVLGHYIRFCRLFRRCITNRLCMTIGMGRGMVGRAIACHARCCAITRQWWSKLLSVSACATGTIIDVREIVNIGGLR